MKRPTTQAEMDERLLISLGSQGTASLAVMLKMLRAFVAKEILSEVEVMAILDAAAESAEKAPDRLGGKYSKSTGATIRQMMQDYLQSPAPGRKH